MAISESQLDTWAKQGSVTQSAQTYQAIKSVLEDVNAPYSARDFSVFLQGSYANDTNVYRESDVDVVIRLNETFYADTGRLSVGAKAHYDNAFVRADVQWSEFRAAVLSWLQEKYGTDVQSGKKAILVKGDGNRRDADVIVCCRFRRYREGSDGVDDLYDEGICFWSDGVRVENFPKQHSANLTSMHQGTNGWLKPVIRVYKNMRNRMIGDEVLKEGTMPSYFIEGMLYNVPNSKFGGTFVDSFVLTYNWILGANPFELVTASGLNWLVREGTQVSISPTKFNEYLQATRGYWTDWGK